MVPARAASGRRAACMNGKATSRGFTQLALKDPVASSFERVGLDTSEGYFGFTPFAELWTGRLAMIGFVSGLVAEVGFNKGGVLEQIGLVPSAELAFLIWGIVGASTLGGIAVTISRAQNKEMTLSEEMRYSSFLGVDRATKREVAVEAARIKDPANDPLGPLDEATVAAAAREATPADAVLGVAGDVDGEAAEAAETAAAMKAQRGVLSSDEAFASDAQAAEATLKPRPSNATLPGIATTTGVDESAEIVEYGRQVELNNGRAAMLGFLLAVGIEASTGHTTFMQIIDIGKAAGLLGSASGFNW